MREDGTTTLGGYRNNGTVFELAPPAAGETAWTESVLHRFHLGGGDGIRPTVGLIVDANGNLYGTTFFGGGSASCSNAGHTTFYFCGMMFELTPPPAGATAWTETVLYRFVGGWYGENPGKLIMGGNGNLCITTGGVGTVFELTPPPVGTAWIGRVLYRFNGDGPDGVIMDTHGSLCGTTASGGRGHGTVFELTPPAAGGITWTETVLYAFNGGGDGADPHGSLIIDANDNLYGSAMEDGNNDYGTVFELVR